MAKLTIKQKREILRKKRESRANFKNFVVDMVIGLIGVMVFAFVVVGAYNGMGDEIKEDQAFIQQYLEEAEQFKWENQ